MPFSLLSDASRFSLALLSLALFAFFLRFLLRAAFGALIRARSPALQRFLLQCRRTLLFRAWRYGSLLPTETRGMQQLHTHPAVQLLQWVGGASLLSLLFLLYRFASLPHPGDSSLITFAFCSALLLLLYRAARLWGRTALFLANLVEGWPHYRDPRT